MLVFFWLKLWFVYFVFFKVCCIVFNVNSCRGLIDLSDFGGILNFRGLNGILFKKFFYLE